ncbi:MAG: hypothetical protein JJT78_07180 [Leptospira sp.]|nr:hypothetical protein [Leptospira sp.]
MILSTNKTTNIGIFLMVFSILEGCAKNNIKGRELWVEKQENIVDVVPSYKLLRKVSGKGCVTKNFLGFISSEKETYYEGIERKDAFSYANSIAAYDALQKEPGSDLFVQTAVTFDKTGNRFCSEVRGLAVQITEISGISRNQSANINSNKVSN